MRFRINNYLVVNLITGAITGLIGRRHKSKTETAVAAKLIIGRDLFFAFLINFNI